MKIRTPHIVITLLSVLLLLSAFLCVWLYLQIYDPGGWRDEVFGLEGMNASRHALDDFQNGHLRLYRIGGESDKARYTGTNEGPFEVWTSQFYPSLGRAHRFSTEQFIEFYNGKMHYMYEHPDKFREPTKEVQPGGADNSHRTGQ